MFNYADPWPLAAVLLALVLGGMLKGATGAGAPVISVPVLAAVFDIRIAIVIMATPNLLTNIWQMWQFRGHGIGRAFTLGFAIAGAVGATLGTVILASLPLEALQLSTALVVIAYIALRLIRPDLSLLRTTADRIVLPMGFAAGILQGAAGVSAPISVSFLNAMRLSRPAFIATISAFFVVMSVVQVPVLFAYDLMTWQLFGVGALALVPLFAGMPLGAAAAERIGPKGFDRIILVFLGLLACRLIWTALA
ncbi:sulfite exporter TauE/SafE family protein [Oceaniovalibus sp. ACAM 378]|uniref:sulfite exporter TauE/SafE family protein n=1 Tax=Oceaniovalibus sp. ACAM 378 TaxID=2599923 RepID=UPI0011D9D8FD|nr:sulfite exporter TauE/SafE family protein [Oceaniovalibus sp. ACAM 378]TYB85170.1 sulfite exporter TauE/SafE family protein [Oceaniovalibus sp. ACAM 378]